MNYWWWSILVFAGEGCEDIVPPVLIELLTIEGDPLFLTLIIISPLLRIVWIRLDLKVLLLRQNLSVDFSMLVFIQEGVRLTQKWRKNLTDILFIILLIFPHPFAWSQSMPCCKFSSFYFYGLSPEFLAFLLLEKNHDLVGVLERAGWAWRPLLYHIASTLEIWSFLKVLARVIFGFGCGIDCSL